MKASKVFIKWIVISLVLQLSVYFYLDRFYFSTGKIKFTEVQDLNYTKEIKPNVTLPESAEKVNLSTDCSYTAYFENGVLKVADTNSGKLKKLSFGEDVQCLSYQWIPDSNRMIIAEKINLGNQKVIRFYSYDADKGLKEEIKDYITQRSNSVPAGIGDVQIDMAMSPQTSVMYAKIKYSNGLSAIYRIDANEAMTKIRTVVKRIGKIGVAAREDQLLYEDLTYLKVRTNTKIPFISIRGNSNLSLLGTDGNNNIYVGNRYEKFSKIYYGTLNESKEDWKEVDLDSTYSQDDFKISSGGKIYFIDKANNSIKEVASEKSYTYKGELVGIYDAGIVSIDNSKIVLQKMK